MARQCLCIEEAILRGSDAGLDWLLHIDASTQTRCAAATQTQHRYCTIYHTTSPSTTHYSPLFVLLYELGVNLQ